MAGYVRLDPVAIATVLASPSGEVGLDLARRATKIERAAKQICPVRTGRLRSSIAWEMGADAGGLVARVGTDVDYAPFVELGTSKMRAQPFLRPAMEAGAG